MPYRASSSSASALHLTAMAAVGVASLWSSLWLYRSVREYGWDSTLRYIWEGDHYTPASRGALRKLEECEAKLATCSSLLDMVETSLERAELESVDGAIVTRTDWEAAHRPQNLEKDLGLLDNQLDKVASSIDTLQTASLHADVKLIKKQLSTAVVDLMNRTDLLLVLLRADEE